MAYLGNNPTSQNFISGTDYFNGTGAQVAFTLTRTVNSVNDVEVVVNNVIQQPNSYTISSTTLTLSAAPSSGTSNVYVRYLATNQQSFTVGNNTIDYNKLTSDMQSKFAMKNRIINGDMRIDQRNAGSAVTITSTVATTYTVDRFYGYGTAASKFSVQQIADAPAGFNNSAKITSLSAYSVSASDLFIFEQKIEGYNVADLGFGTANAKTVTLSFWVKSSLTGTFGGSLRSLNDTRSYPYSYTISAANTWEQKTITVVGDTTGTWNTTNSDGMKVGFSMGAGSTSSGTANAWAGTVYVQPTGSTSVVGTSGATFYITGVQLEVGSSATGYEYRMYGQELALCQRYYSKLTSFGTNGQMGVGMSVSSSSSWLQVSTPVNLRANPTIGFSNLTVSDQVNYALAVTSVAATGAISSGAGIAFAHSGGATTLRTAILATSTSAGYVDFSAEL